MFKYNIKFLLKIGFLLLLTSENMIVQWLIMPTLHLFQNQFTYLNNANFIVKLIPSLHLLVVAIIAFLFTIMPIKFNNVKLISFGLIAFSCGGFGYFYYDNIVILLLLRVIQGVGVCFIFSGAFSIANEFLSEKKSKNLFFAMNNIFTCITIIISGIVAIYLSNFGLKYVFIPYFLGLVFFIISLFVFRGNQPFISFEKRDQNEKFFTKKLITILIVIILQLIIWNFFILMSHDILIKKGFHSVKNILLYLNGNPIGIIIGSLISPKFATKFGYKKVNILVSIILIIACLGFYFANTINLVFLSFVVSNMAAGMIFATAAQWIILIGIKGQEQRSINIATFAFYICAFFCTIVIRIFNYLNFEVNQIFIILMIIAFLLAFITSILKIDTEK